MKKKQRLTGIDLFRGIAVYAVVILHSDEGISVASAYWENITQFSGFAVPFFLATSFYLAIDKIYKYGGQYQLKSRITRLLIPYLFWTIFYLLYKVAKYSINKEADNLKELFQDPASLIFLGGAAFHLYFLPLLLTGTSIVKLSEYLIKKQIKLKNLIYLCILSLAIYELLLFSDNSVQLGPNIAFQPLLELIWSNGNKNQLVRIILVGLSWILRCLPYIFIAMILSHPSIRERIGKFINKFPLSWAIIFAIANLYGNNFLPQSIHEVARGYLALVLAISLSNYVQDNRVIDNLGTCSFGIYLIHLLVIEACQIIGNRINPSYINRGSTLTLLSVSILSFIITWIIAYLLLKRKSISKIIFGT